ncbi:Cell division coordinator CpoB [subsurface metagenome]
MHSKKQGSFYYPVSVLIIVFLLFVKNNTFASARKKVNQGNNYYGQEKYEKAIERYRDAQIDSPESHPVHFNLGDSLYKTGKYEDAVKEFEKSTYSRDIALQSKAYYNMGNSFYRMGKLPESILYYKKALEIDPEDEDAKYNIEFVQKKIKEMMDKQKDQKQDSGQQQQQQQKQQQQSQQGEEKKEEDEKEARKEEKERKEGEMSEEDARRILNALEDDEKKAQKEKAKTIRRSGIYVEEDW